jgi:hypothetical protein
LDRRWIRSGLRRSNNHLLFSLYSPCEYFNQLPVWDRVLHWAL